MTHGDQDALARAVAEHRHMRQWGPYRMELSEAPTPASRVYRARLGEGRCLVRELAWERQVDTGALEVRQAVMLVDAEGEVQARREW